MKIILCTLIFFVGLSNCDDVCKPASCSSSGPVVRFPFWLKNRHPDWCGFPGFELSCSRSGDTELDFLFPVKASIDKVTIPLNMTVSVGVIDYKEQKMLVRNSVARSCLPERPPRSNFSAFPFEVEPLGYDGGYTLFNCTNARDNGNRVACLSSQSYEVVAFGSIYEITSLPPRSSCFPMYNISFVPDNLYGRQPDDYGGTPYYLHWRKPDCHNCYGKGRSCRLRNGSIAGQTECFKLGVTVGTVLVLFIVAVIYSAKRNRDNLTRFKRSSANHEHMKAMIRCSYKDLKRITRNFEEKLGQGSLYKGMLSDKTPVAVKILRCSAISADDLNDGINRMGAMHHENVLRVIGYCIDEPKKALVYEISPRGALEEIMSSEILDGETQRRVAVGIAKGIEYVRRGCGRNIFDLKINPRDVLVDRDFNPKVLVCPLSDDREANDYTAPELSSTSDGIARRKADVYGFGMVVLEMVSRMSDSDEGAAGQRRREGEEKLLEWVCNRLKNEDWELKKIGVLGLWCIEWFPCNRPSIEQVIQMLEEDAN
ncbi:rust resistance kinase Lr10-like isoform X2 [Andrographis paniculata]|uniref:rust resistance kinase Lr10-like isoform X2 n=1 Tax=Andrographis paniculata TaxID=175694 RepID=UPI0021E869CD|nr:rust resistance kinase Lr10-like isoform X2 [Andrographis paniculata]